MLSEQRVLWIEAGAMSGGSRNQVEFGEDLAPFFCDPPPTVGAQETVNIGVNLRWLECVFTGKLTTFKVPIWRLSLPTLTRGGFDYPGSVLRFERSGPSGSKYFNLTFASPDSADARN